MPCSRPTGPRWNHYLVEAIDVLSIADYAYQRGGLALIEYLSASQDERTTMLNALNSYDLSTFAGVTAVLTAVAIAASYVPPLRAMRLDPITTLHAE
jgi:ABC-type lipoprotein release transport system permease subunit